RVDPTQIAPAIELCDRVEERPACGLAAKASAMSTARSSRCGPSGAMSTATASPTTRPARLDDFGPRVNPKPSPTGSMTARTRIPLTVPAMWCRGLVPPDQKTLITHGRTGAARFLGYEITVQHSEARSPEVAGRPTARSGFVCPRT